MRKATFIIGFLLLIATAFGETIKIQDALNAKKIICSITGNYNPNKPVATSDTNSSYYGKCMIIKIKNTSTMALNLEIDPGLMLMCNDTNIQDMVVTKFMLAEILPGKDVTLQLYAMCSEMHDGAPNINTRYKIGKMANKNLVSIARTINKMNMHNKIGQGAVWAYTDRATKNDLATIGATEISIRKTIEILNLSGVKTKLNRPTPKAIIQSAVRDTAQASGSNDPKPVIKEKNAQPITINEVKNPETANQQPLNEDQITLSIYWIYTGIGVIILLLATVVYLLARKKKKDDNVASF
jgi:hypothetical protein